MPTARMTDSYRRSALLAIAMAAASGPVFATKASEIQAQYQKEVAACKAGQTGQELSACMKEAQNSAGEARRGLLGAGTTGDVGANVAKRCDALKADERAACVARMSGQGTTRGSVSSGGVYRELVTRETVPASAPVQPKP